MKTQTKRLLSVFLSLCLLIGLLQVSVLAAEKKVKEPKIKTGYCDENGEFKEGKLKQSLPNGIVSVDKSIKKVKNTKNDYDVTLKVVAEKTETTVLPGSAATVLVIDTSGSMEGNRIDEAKKAAKTFVNSFGGTSANTGRYVAIVEFADTQVVRLNWTDVSTPEGKANAINEIDKMVAGGGTNLQAALAESQYLLQNDIVKNIPKDSKNVIALTDGAPTFFMKESKGFLDRLFNLLFKEPVTVAGNQYYIYGKGSTGSAKTIEETSKTAKTLKDTANVYTVCYGAKDDYTYVDGRLFAKDEYGPKVGAFLRDNISSGASFAYDADNATQLSDAFKAITEKIVTGLDGKGLKVKNALSKYTEASNLDPITVSDNNFEWKLENPKVTVEGTKTVYTYTLTYRVKLDANNSALNENDFYPVSGDTYLEFPNEDGSISKIKFPTHAVKIVKSRYVVTYTDGVDGEVVFADKVFKKQIHGSKTPTIKDPTREGYDFVAWNPTFSDEVVNDITYVAQWKKVSPETTTKAPETTTEVPETTTKAPETTTEVPETTTKAPETTTKAPETTTSVVIVDDETPLGTVPSIPSEKNPMDETSESTTIAIIIDDETPLGSVPHTADSTNIASAVAAIVVTGAACAFVMKKKEEN